MSLLMDALKKAEQDKKKAAEGLKKARLGDAEAGMGFGRSARDENAGVEDSGPVSSSDTSLSLEDLSSSATGAVPQGGGLGPGASERGFAPTEVALERTPLGASRDLWEAEALTPDSAPELDREATLPSRRAVKASLKDYFDSSQTLGRSRTEPSAEVSRGGRAAAGKPFTRVSADTVFAATHTVSIPRTVSLGLLAILVLSVALAGIWIWTKLDVESPVPRTAGGLAPEPQTAVAALEAQEVPREEGPVPLGTALEFSNDTRAGSGAEPMTGEPPTPPEPAPRLDLTAVPSQGSRVGADGTRPQPEAGRAPADTVAAAVPQAAHRAEQWVVEPSAIKITKRRTPERVNPRLKDAYAAYQRGDLARAQRLYRAVLSQEPDQRDALLGLAALALRTGRLDDASRYYRRLIEINPRDGVAQAALANLPGGEGAGASESRMKLLLDETPEAAHLHFSLGNFYARQGRWAEAQEAYFKAYTKAPGDPDYLFNLAVSLDRLGQLDAAIRFYRQALELAARLPVSFNIAVARSRLSALAQARGAG